MKLKKPGLIAGYRHEQEQQRIKEEHGITQPNVVVVERKSRVVMIWKNTLRFLLFLLRTAATVLLVALAVVGLAALIFPESRMALYDELVTALEQITMFLG